MKFIEIMATLMDVTVKKCRANREKRYFYSKERKSRKERFKNGLMILQRIILNCTLSNKNNNFEKL